MKKFDYYIIKQFLFTFGLSISLILAIAVIFDFSEKIDNFIDNQAPTDLIIKNYYANFIIHYGVVFSGLITFVSVIFFTSRLSDNNEIIALYNSKISPYRVLLPYAIGALCIFLPNIYFQNSFLPSKNEERLKFEKEYIRNKDIYRARGLHKQIDKNTFVFIKNYDIKKKKGYLFNLQDYDNNQMTRQISSGSISWNDEYQTWQIKNYIEKEFQSEYAIKIQEGKEKLINLNINPEEIFQQNIPIKSMTFNELRQFISTAKQTGNKFLPIYQIEQNERFSYAFSIFIFTLLGFLISNKKNRGGLGYKLTTGLAVCFFYIFLMKFTVTFTINSNVPAFITVWLPNILYLLACGALFKKLT